ncbi:HdeD family acid-resistance protein [Actinomadura nitritigenes]|uniref:HdeD family acid-resistance protein n=1 Tax=Actinomadura nitritigenes TaxID=134602 RepID=UPI003D8EFDCB
MSVTQPNTGADLPRPPDEGDGTLLMRLADGHWALPVLAGVLSFVLGLAIVCWPQATIGVIAVLIGLQFVFGGIVRLVQAIFADGDGGSRVLFAVLGALSLVVGVLALRDVHRTVAVLALIVGIAWLAGGVIEFVIVLSDKARPGRRATLVVSALSVLAGIVLLAFPDITLTALTWGFGLWLITWGILTVLLALWIRHAVTKAEAEAEAT